MQIIAISSKVDEYEFVSAVKKLSGQAVTIFILDLSDQKNESIKKVIHSLKIEGVKGIVTLCSTHTATDSWVLAYYRCLEDHSPHSSDPSSDYDGSNESEAEDEFQDFEDNSMDEADPDVLNMENLEESVYKFINADVTSLAREKKVLFDDQNERFSID
jgi:hypothetical protein